MNPMARTCGTSPITATSSAPTAPWGAGSGSASTPTARWPGGRPGSSGPTAPASAPPTTRCRSPRRTVSSARAKAANESKSNSAGRSRSSAWPPAPGPHHRPARGRLRPRGADRSPAQLDLDVTWTTDGVPYHYDLTTRYEIPCLVRGTVTVDGETFTVDGQGQRDHSWGVRDWWAFGWCWCSLRLDDGTRVHLADIRMNIGVPVFFGYIQKHGAGLSRHGTLGDRRPRRPRIPLQSAYRHRGRPRPRPRTRPGDRGHAGRLRARPPPQRRWPGQPVPPGPRPLPRRRRPRGHGLDRVEPARPPHHPTPPDFYLNSPVWGPAASFPHAAAQPQSWSAGSSHPWGPPGAPVGCVCRMCQLPGRF